MRIALNVLLSCAIVWASSYPASTSCWAEDPNMGILNMYWAKPTVRSNTWTVRSGDGCSGDPTTYTPGALTPIHIRTLGYKRQFRGLLIYGTAQNTGARVGDWQLDWPNSNMFWKPQNSQCQNKSLMHLNAVEKYYHHVLWYIAPPAGTGPVEFHVLLKRGPANSGEFYWPNLAGNLVLQEGGAAASDKWVQGQPGQTCNQVCQGAGSTCDQALLTNAYLSGTFINRDVLYSSGCNVPAVENEWPVPYRDPFGWCYYPSSAVGPNSTACTFAAPNGTIPVCPCGNAGLSPRVYAPIASTCLNDFVAMGGASQVSSSLVSIALMLLTTFWFHQPRKSSSLILCAFLLGSAHVAQAHNWVYSVSRSFNQASTYKPCRPKVDDQPHWEINEGQMFAAEWATGHDWYFYFTVVASADQDILNNLQEYQLDNYVGNCTASQDYMRQLTNAPFNFTKQHCGTNVNEMSIVGLFDNLPIYSTNVSATDPRFIARHPKFGPLQEVRFLYTPQNVDLDLRCSYYNAEYPYLIAVHRFVQVQTALSRAGERDIAQFTINLDATHKAKGYGEGAYIVQYLWRGYFDCIDVNLFEPPTVVQESLIGGRAILPTEPQWNKVDHCQFEEIQALETPCLEVVTDALNVQAACLQARQGLCGGVNVVPLWLPNEVFPLFSNRVSVPFDMPMSPACKSSDFASLPVGTMVGYGVNPRAANSTFSQYSVTDDPEDPLWFSTCYIKKPAWVFDLQLPNVNTTQIYVPPPWAYNDRCVDCTQWSLAQDTNIIPRWSPIPQHCRNCLLESLSAPPAQIPALTVISRGQQCDGMWSGGTTKWYYGAPNAQCSNVRCVKDLILAGSANFQPQYTITAAECVAKAAKDPECAGVVTHNSANNVDCHCWLNTNPACCGTCKPVDYIFASNIKYWQYNTYSTVPPVGDSTCATGIKSADGANCCPTSCGFCQSNPLFQVSFQSASLVAPAGMAVDTGAPYSAKSGQNQSFNTYGWNCNLGPTAGDRDSASHFPANNPFTSGYHSTYIQTDFKTCGNAQAQWNLLVGSNGTTLNYDVHVLYSQPGASLSGCTLNGIPAYDGSHSRLGNSEMAWVVRGLNITTGKITFAGDNQHSCSGISALFVFPASSTGSGAINCQNLPGTCCPHLLAMSERPCASYPPPCSSPL